jgi:hypothetical protein
MNSLRKSLHTLAAIAALVTPFSAVLVPAGALAQAQAQTGAFRYQYALPSGWSRTQDGDTEVLAPGSEPAGTAQVLLLAPKALAGDFDQQFASERAQLEQFWGLRAPAPVLPQRGQSAQGPYAAHFASYASDGGPRYMSFLAQANGRQFVMLVFVAASDLSFNRVAPQATQLFTTLQVVQ